MAVGLDIGQTRTGVAKAFLAENKIIIKPLKILKNPKSNDLLSELRKFNFAELVIGLPLDGYGNETEQSVKIRNIARRLQQRLPANSSVILHDEYCSSETARERLDSLCMKRDYLDDVAAAVILEDYFKLLGKKTLFVL